MPAKNKQQRNAFWFYMQELIVELKREGRVFPGGMADVVPIAHPRYKALDDKERERFENMAKEYKKRMRGQPGDAIRQDSAGNIIAHRRDDVLDYEREREKEIKELVRRWPKDQSLLMEENFHFIDVQVLCKTPDNQYLPVEIALVEFSLKDGIRKSYHQFLKPGPIPSGMRYECMSKSEDTHRIPVDGHPSATGNYLSVQNSIENFVNPEGKLPKNPPVFALREEWQKVDYTLNYIRHNSCMGRQVAQIKVYELESLFISLVEFAGKSPGPSKGYAAEVLTSSTHDFLPGLKCSFHEELECQHCSLLWVRKFSYAFSDALKKDYLIEIKPHRHLPSRKGEQFSISKDSSDLWGKTVHQSNPDTSSESYKMPANVPKTASVLIPSRVAQPAPIFRPPGAPNLDYAINKTSDIRYQQQAAWRAPTPSMPTPFPSGPSTRAPSPPFSDDEDDFPTMPSQNTDLAKGREATWVPDNRSKGTWSRRTTPASTPRATPMATPLATPMATPLATPHHSPPRNGALFPTSFVTRNEMGPPPGFSPQSTASHGAIQGGLQNQFQQTSQQSQFSQRPGPSPFGRPPPGFTTPVGFGSRLDTGTTSTVPSGWGGGESDAPLQLERDFPSLSMHSSPGKGRGRGSALAK